MDSNLVVIGLNFRSAPVEVRERFWAGENDRVELLQQVAKCDAVDEVAVIATCARTEFLIWTSDVVAAANALLAFLTRAYNLRLCEWKHFYRLLDEDAIRHVFRVTAGLDSMVLGEAEIVAQVKTAWLLAQQARTTGHFLDAVFQKALAVSKRARIETAIGSSNESVPSAAVALAQQTFGSLEGRKVLVLGAGKMGASVARNIVQHGAAAVRVVSRTYERALTLANTLGGSAATMDDLWKVVAESDIVISSTGCPHFLITKEELERIVTRREQPLLLVDIAVPRNIDPAVRSLPHVALYDIDALDEVVGKGTGERQAATVAANALVSGEARKFRQKLAAERVVPTITAVREYLEAIAEEELDQYRREFGPLEAGEEQAIRVIGARIVHRIAGSLARELKDLPDKPEQDQLTIAIQRLFHLEAPRPALVGRGN